MLDKWLTHAVGPVHTHAVGPVHGRFLSPGDDYVHGGGQRHCTLAIVLSAGYLEVL